MRDHLMGFAPIAALIAEEHEGRKPQRTPERPRLTAFAEAMRRAVDVQPATSVELSALERAEEIVSADTDAHRYLVDHRGGCRCFLAPPCYACCEPLTEEEADLILDWHDGRQTPQAGEWIEWHGGECPTDPNTRVGYRMAGSGDCYAYAADLRWSRDGCHGDITAYRVEPQ